MTNGNKPSERALRAARRCERMPVSSKHGTAEIVERMANIIDHEISPSDTRDLLDAAKHALQWFRDFDQPERCETERAWLEQAIPRVEV